MAAANNTFSFGGPAQMPYRSEQACREQVWLPPSTQYHANNSAGEVWYCMLCTSANKAGGKACRNCGARRQFAAQGAARAPPTQWPMPTQPWQADHQPQHQQLASTFQATQLHNTIPAQPPVGVKMEVPVSASLADELASLNRAQLSDRISNLDGALASLPQSPSYAAMRAQLQQGGEALQGVHREAQADRCSS